MRVITGAEEAAANTAALDPTLLALLSIFGGALLTAAFGVWGAWRQSRREHTRWLRERRFEAYREFVTVARRYIEHRMAATDLRVRVDAARARGVALESEFAAAPDGAARDAVNQAIEKLEQELDVLFSDADDALNAIKRSETEATERIASFYLLGPGSVAEAAASLGEMLANQDANHAAGLRDLEVEMRKALGVDDY